MPMLSVGTEQGTPVELYYEVRGAGKPVVLIHGWPLSGRSWEKQVPALVEAGYKVITYDRRGFGGSTQADGGYDYDTLALDLKKLIETLDLHDATLVGFSMGGGEVARYLSSYGTAHVHKAVFAAAVPPYLYKADDNPEGGLDDATINQFLEGVKDDRLAFLEEFTKSFFNAGERSNLVSEPNRQYHRNIAAFASPQATYDCIKAFSYTDFRKDLTKIDIPTLVLHGDSDGIVPFEVSGKRAQELLPNAQTQVIKGGPHGLNATHPDEFNQALISFLNE
ncbi:MULTISPECIES: alpha/beta fold hydrolase [unclassified Halomonas]|uniref:alpha/beta fold hydrolase n=1 Tax=unclassified Halomonas TaxID=2609666 RepID=UPI001CF27E72|nr:MULTISPECIES: alpha/beta hydrolase [unclassified Halomonas]MCA8863856.1 alpha/beta hydrolase [Halomonas sp. SBBP1]UZH11100.1 alpha/beta hydrolase [Halomonas sp. BDJS001]